MKPTNKHIADHALRLFNQRGFVNVRLQQIADAAFVSVGHLAYYFKNKDAFVDYLFEQHRQESQVLLQSFRIMPLFQDFDRMLCELFVLQEKYSFLYVDMLELVRAYPTLAARYREHAEWQKMQLTLMLDFHVSRGAIVLPNKAVTLDYLADVVLQHLENWRQRQLIKGAETYTYDAFCNDTWKVLLPFCSPEGLKELNVNA
jgi:AcrR family transcriptional regulator